MKANENAKDLNQWFAVLNCKTEQDHWRSVKADWKLWQSSTHLDRSDSECSDSSCNAFKRSECLCYNWNMLFCDVVFVLVLFALSCLSVFTLIWFISVDDFFFHLIFNVDHAVYHQRNEEHLTLIWFILVNDFFFLLIFDVSHVIYHWRDEECNELWYELFISLILLIW